MSDSTKPSAVVVPSSGTKSEAAEVTPMKGGVMLSPLPLGGGKRRKTRKISKKVKAMLKKMTPKQLKKMMKGGEEVSEEAPAMGGRKRKTARKSRRSHLLY